MDVNFHYFAVKTLARKANFSEDDAQTIAEYSQFVDDYTTYKNIMLSDVPDYARCLAYQLPIGWYFYTVTTGFDSWLDLSRLIVPKYQREICVPFHFVPYAPLQQLHDPRSVFRTQPADMVTPSLMQSMMANAKDAYLGNKCRQNLMKIGMLLHLFADTYAHQNFSGFQGWENYCELTRVVSNIDGSDITSQFSPSFYYHLPAVGHTEASHAPDLSYLSFDVRMKLSESDDYTYYYNRSNTQIFTIAAHQIIDFLCDCNNTEHINDWDSFSLELAQGFLTTSENVSELCTHWQSVFSQYAYQYDKNSLMGDVSNFGKVTDDFFLYNVNAINIRDAVIATKATNIEENTDFMAEMQQINMR